MTIKLTKAKDFRKEDWFKSVQEEGQAIITETIFISRQTFIEGKHQLGKLVWTEVMDHASRASYGQQILTALATSWEVSERELERCIAFARKFPNLEEFWHQCIEGKNISWNKIIKNYMPAVPPTECQHLEKITICRRCRIKLA